MRIFGKPEIKGHRRMAVILATDESVEAARDKAERAYEKLKVNVLPRNERSKECRRLTVMMRVADVARADIALTPDRIYYRFATDDSIEDGELPASKEDFGALAARLNECAVARENECPLKQDVGLSLFCRQPDFAM